MWIWDTALSSIYQETSAQCMMRGCSREHYGSSR